MLTRREAWQSPFVRCFGPPCIYPPPPSSPRSSATRRRFFKQAPETLDDQIWRKCSHRRTFVSFACTLALQSPHSTMAGSDRISSRRKVGRSVYIWTLCISRCLHKTVVIAQQPLRSGKRIMLTIGTSRGRLPLFHSFLSYLFPFHDAASQATASGNPERTATILISSSEEGAGNIMMYTCRVRHPSCIFQTNYSELGGEHVSIRTVPLPGKVESAVVRII